MTARPILLLFTALLLVSALRAELRLPAIIGDRMVLQQQQANPIWGWDRPGAPVTVTFAGETLATTADAAGKWRVSLPARPASDQPRTLTVAGTSTVVVQDVLVGEVWLCSGQSNMQFTLGESYDGDLEAAAARLPAVRLITVPQVASQEPRDDFQGRWVEAAPATAGRFSAVGFLFGRALHEILGVPVGLIDVTWGGSKAEAWVRRTSLEQDPRFRPLLDEAVAMEARLATPEAEAKLAADLKAWEAARDAARAAGAAAPPRPQDWLRGQHRPGNLFAGMLHPTVGYGLKGVIWYQGEGNAGRPEEYAELFPFLIEQWRREWGQGDFPFYWVQLADYKAETDDPGADSGWARLREAQTRTLRLPNTGQAVAIDVGEGRDIHPRDKHRVAARLVRWALAKDYGRPLPHRSPEFRSLEITGDRALVTFDCFGGQLYAFDEPTVRGFAVCGADRVWHWATGRIVGRDRVEVRSDAVSAPIAVRYAFADNPRTNLYSRAGLPATPFRTDDFAFVPPTPTPPTNPPAPVATAADAKVGDSARQATSR